MGNDRSKFGDDDIYLQILHLIIETAAILCLRTFGVVQLFADNFYLILDEGIVGLTFLHLLIDLPILIGVLKGFIIIRFDLLQLAFCQIFSQHELFVFLLLIFIL